MSPRDSAVQSEPMTTTEASSNGHHNTSETAETEETVDTADNGLIHAMAATPGTHTQAHPTEIVVGRRRRAWPWLVAGAAIGAGATVGVRTWTDTDQNDDAVASTEVVELTTAEITTRDLIEYVEYDGELSRGDSVSIPASTAGTITDAVAIGSLIGRGTNVASVDASPVVAFYGSQPFYRDVESGDDGSDVLQLEANLWALGFTDDGALSVDGTYDSATTDAVEAWQASLGNEETGDFSAGSVVLIDGPSIVSEIATPGDTAAPGQQLLLTQTLESRTDVTLDATGLDETAVIDDLAAVGTSVGQGTVLATIDGQPVVALTDVSAVTADILEAFADEDIERLENLLVFFGLDPDGAIVVDDEADLTTVAGVIRWQASIGVPESGTTGSPYYVVVPDGLEVVEVISTPGDPIGVGALAMSLGVSTTSVTTDIVVNEIDDIAVGQTLEVELADESILPATVESISDTADESTDDTIPTVAVTIALDEVPDDIVVGPVTLRFETSRIDQATVVPTRALVSLAEGGFAVEVSSADGSTRLIGVELGTFDDGVAEVVAGDLAPGDLVVVPS